MYKGKVGFRTSDFEVLLALFQTKYSDKTSRPLDSLVKL